jgi:hypothetical protein
MKIIKTCTCFALFVLFANQHSLAQDSNLFREVEQTMLRSTRYLVEKVSANGGYVWYYMPDFSRRWGEMEAYKTMIWLQNPGTVSMGNVFLEAYRATGNEYYYQAAEKVGYCIVWGQSSEGGWNYMIDFAGDRSLKQWYNTIGKNGWRLEEFQHYYGNSTFDDDVTANTAHFLLKMYLEKMDPVWKPPLEKAISFILESQYPLGGWPQRYPLKFNFNKEGHPDYTSFYTFNDGVILENINFLIQCYLTLGEERFLDPIRRGMNFYITSQDSCGGWGDQLNMSLEIAGARTYEPKALLPGTTFENAMSLLTFYQYTGDKKFLIAVKNAINWMAKTSLSNDKDGNGTFIYPTFVEVGTNRPLYSHRIGSNSKYGKYYVDYSDKKLLGHYNGKRMIPFNQLRDEYNRIAALPTEEATKDSPLKVGRYMGDAFPQSYHDQNTGLFFRVPDEKQVRSIIESLDNESRWLVKHVSISHPYTSDGQKQELTDEFSSTNVGDETDTSPFRDPSDQTYISVPEYIRNMSLLVSYIRSLKANNSR